MTDKDRLIELQIKAYKEWQANTNTETSVAEFVADYLLANGVIVPACDFKNTIYRVGKNKIYGDWELMYIQVYPDEVLYIYDSDNYFTENDIGKTVFLTKEEAEEKLKECNNA